MTGAHRLTIRSPANPVTSQRFSHSAIAARLASPSIRARDTSGKWKGDAFVGGMRYGEIPGTGQLQRILFNENMEELRREPLLADLRQRIRDVRQGPDELLYLLVDHDKDGAVLEIEPAN